MNFGTSEARSEQKMGLTRALHGLCALGAAIIMMALVSAPARADLGFDMAGTGVTLSTTQAGAHPDLTTSFLVNRKPDGSPDGDIHGFKISLPAGIIGAVRDVPACTEDQLQLVSGCPVDSQVGTVDLTMAFSTFTFHLQQPVFNVVPRPGAAAQFGFTVFILAQPVRVTVRADDYGLDTVAEPIAREGTIAVIGASLTLWGVPADPSHDPFRLDPTTSGTGLSSQAPRRALLTNPARCGEASVATLAADSWQDQGHSVTTTVDVPAFTGCDRLPQIRPRATVAPESLAAGQPSGYDIDVVVPQADNPYEIATPPARTIDVALPEGTAISPGAADGLGVCKDEQIGFKSSTPVQCPEASKVGSAFIDTPALKEPLVGSMYLRESSAEHMFRMVLVAEGPGVLLKLPGDVTVDAKTGQVVTHFDDAPQFPFTQLHVHLKGGSRALLANAPSCGTYTTTVSLTPYGGGAPGVATSQFDLSADGHGAACPASMPFSPALSAGVVSPVAGTSSPFTFRLTRADGQRELGAIANVHLPAGLLADVSRVPLCPESQATTASCPESTRVGGVQVGSGPGGKPLYLPGRVYLTGAYKGGQFGLSIVVDAITGPYDLGTVNVRAAIKVNRDASLTVDSDPLPTMLQGVPLRLRDIALTFDRPGFMINPTSCSPTTITGTAVSVDGATAALSDRFQLGDCAALAYKPKLTLALGGREKSGVTSLTAHVATRAGDANSRRISVELPRGVGLNINNGAGLCTSQQFAARSCPANSIVGHASVDSILHEPLSGPVYFVQGAGSGAKALPRLFIPLTGEGVTIDLVAQSSLKSSRIVTTFDPIPDVPFSAFDLEIDGGAHGILAMDRNACRSTLTSPVQMDGYNGKFADTTIVVPAGCPLRIVAKQLTPRRLTLKVSGLGAGVLRLRGSGLRAASRTIGSGIQVASISASRTRASVPVGVTLTFDPAGSAKAKTLRVALPNTR